MTGWDELRIALEVHRGGSLAGAARRLKVDATTVGRRLTALERQLGGPLFVRRRGDWRLTDLGERVVEAAERAERAVIDALRAAEDVGDPQGAVTVTAPPEVGEMLVAPGVAALRRSHPGITILLVCSLRIFDLARGEADVAVRVGRPRDPSLVGRRLSWVRERYYASPAWLAEHGVPESLEGVDLVAHLPRPTPEGAQVVFSTNSVTSLLAAAEAGIGVALLPDLMARGRDLVPLDALPSFEELPIWLVAHRDLAKTPRVRAVMDAIVASFDRISDRDPG
jgi:DNA-binding transcriptional LysR family regulator